MLQKIIADTGFLHIPEKWEVEYYLRATQWTQTNGLNGELSAKFITDGLVRDYGVSDCYILVLETRGMAWRVPGQSWNDTIEFEALPEFNPNRLRHRLTVDQMNVITRICRWVQEGATWVIKYTGAGVRIEITGNNEKFEFDIPSN